MTPLLPADDSTCGWVNLLPPRPTPRRLAGTVRADWAVLGAGYTGVAAARRLAELQPDARVVVVDAQRAGESSSGRNSGFAVDVSTSRTGTGGVHDDIVARKYRLNTAAIAWLRELVEREGIDCQWREAGKYHCAAEPASLAEVDAIAAFCARLGFAHQRLDREALAARLGTDYYLGAVYTPGAVLVQPAALARGLALSLPESVALYEESPVSAIDYGREVRLRCAQGEVRAANLLLAGNGFLPGLGVLRSRLAPLVLTASLTRPLDAAERAAIGDPGDWGVLSAHATGATVRYTPDHRVMIRNTSEYWPALAMDPGMLEQRRAIHRRGLRARFPALDRLEIESTWSGVVCVSRNLNAFFGRLASNVYCSAGYNGSGVTRGTIGGRLLADLALGVESPLLADARGLPGPSWNPPRPLLDAGIRWRIRRARRGVGRGGWSAGSAAG